MMKKREILSVFVIVAILMLCFLPSKRTKAATEGYVCTYNGTSYKTIEEAMVAIENSKTKSGSIKMVSDVTSMKSIDISGINVTLDLAGYTIEYPNVEEYEYFISVLQNASLRVLDSVGTGAILAPDVINSIIYVEEGTLIWDSGKLASYGVPGNSEPQDIGILCFGGKIIINGGTINSSCPFAMFGDLEEKIVFEMHGGLAEGKLFSAFMGDVDSSITGGKITAEGENSYALGICGSSQGGIPRITITGGEFYGTMCAILAFWYDDFDNLHPMPDDYFVKDVVPVGYQLSDTSTSVSDNLLMSAKKLIVSPCNYQVTFDANGGKVTTPTKNVAYKGAYGNLPTPTKSGYQFVGWYTEKNVGTKITSTSKYELLKGQTLYARWAPNKYKVTFHANGGTKLSSSAKTVTYGSTYSTLPTVKRTGYTFAGWYTKASGGSKVATTTKVGVAGNHTLYAHWTANKYKVTFHANGGKKPSSSAKTVTYQGAYSTLPTVKRTGYSFAGWYTKASGGSKVTTKTKVGIAGNHTLYAHWTANKYKVTFHANGGAKPSKSAITVTYNKKFSGLATVKRSGYTFSGWYTKKSGGTKVTSSTTVKTTKNITLYARWKKVTVSKPTIKSISSKNKKIYVSEKAVSGAKGYAVTISTNSKFTRGVKKYVVSSPKQTISGLKKGTKYYVRVRAYKKDSAGKAVYSSWSKTKTIRVR